MIWLDAHQKVREGGRVINTAFVVATPVNEHGVREVIGGTVAGVESEVPLTGFLRLILARSLAKDRRAAPGSACRVHLPSPPDAQGSGPPAEPVSSSILGRLVEPEPFGLRPATEVP